MNTAGKISMLVEMMDSGMFCKCKRLKVKELDLDDNTIIVHEIKHNKKCTAVKKLKGLLK